MANDFKSRSTELKPREMMERAARPADLPPEALIAILLKTGAAGCDVVELGARSLRLSPDELRQRVVRKASDAHEIFRMMLAPDEMQENFWVLPLDTKFHPLCEPILICRGTRDGESVHIREVFREAIRWNARGIMVAHNHPTGDPTPSDDDLVLTRRLIEVSKVVGVDLLDHLILGDQQSHPPFASLRSSMGW